MTEPDDQLFLTPAERRRLIRRASEGETNIAEFALKQQMAAKRRQIRKLAGANSDNRAIKTAANRFAREKARKLKKNSVGRRSWAIPRRLLLRGRTESQLLDSFDAGRPRRWKPLVARRFKREPARLLLGSLNFLDDPEGTIREFQRLSHAESTEISAFLDFSDSHCLDIGAYLVLAEVWPQLAKVFRGGRMSQSVQKVLSAIQVDRELGIGLFGVRDHADVWAFPIRHRRPKGTTTSPTANLQPQDREKLADEFCDLVDEWLEVASEETGDDDSKWELSDEGRALISNMSGEILCNAERHSFAGSSDGDWSMTAFMAARETEDGKRELRCYMAFLSVGQSIAESMTHASADLLQAAERYLCQFGRRGPSKATLMTVLALQDAVTSDTNAKANGRGGTGLQDVLELVSDLGASHADNADVRVTIVSGKSCIRLNHPHLLGERDKSGRRVQWCNPWNDPTRPPDKDTAFDLSAHFAGTLVSAGFTLDPRLYVNEAIADDAVDQP